MPPLSYYDKLGLSPIPRRTPITSITFKRKSIKLLIIVYERVSKKSTNVDTYGHWWVEFDNESYGWWPAHGVSLWETLTGVPGQLNGMGENPDPQRDVHHGDTAEKEFYPYLYVGNIFPTYNAIWCREREEMFMCKRNANKRLHAHFRTFLFWIVVISMGEKLPFFPAKDDEHVLFKRSSILIHFE